MYVCFFSRRNERYAIFADDTDFDNRQLGAFVDVPFGLYLFITKTSKSMTIIITYTYCTRLSHCTRPYVYYQAFTYVRLSFSF